MADNVNTRTHLQATTAAAVVSRLCTHPLDTIKTRLQATQGLRGRHWLGTVRHTLATEPLTAFYRGLPVALAFSIPALTTYLTTYEAAKAELTHFSHLYANHPGLTGVAARWLSETAVGNYALSAMAAEGLSGLIWTPMEVLKNRLQVVQTSPTPPEATVAGVAVNAGRNGSGRSTSATTWALARTIYCTDGLRGFFRGYWLSLAVFMPHTVIYFVTYERLKQWWPVQATVGSAGGADTQVEVKKPAALPFYAYLSCAAAASVLSASISNIFDVVKTKWQVNQVVPTTVGAWSFGVASGSGIKQQQQRPRRVMELVQYMWRHEGGYRAFTRGMLARVIWMTPSVTISMTTYELLKRRALV
ncbi:hypothetical protein IWQ60_008450 [Tieghemiomyces parasiticus]|uniref:Mitochondrial carrier protein n=1 Tax=Tieghemiomyces parasiticus TaxID=78921 RepID=A0A9W7ZXP4_9FUNG|nr:hypothetical protein IWQ60_008450 [Tieghemiomyces parasiticus]